MKSLLEDQLSRFTAHIEKKDYPIYALVVSKTGAKLKESGSWMRAPDPAGQDKNNFNATVNAGSSGGRGSSVVDLGHGASISSSGGRIEARKVQMSELVETLWRYVDRPVVDMTGLTGRYDLSLAYGVEELRNMLRVVHVGPAGSRQHAAAGFDFRFAESGRVDAGCAQVADGCGGGRSDGEDARRELADRRPHAVNASDLHGIDNSHRSAPSTGRAQTARGRGGSAPSSSHPGVRIPRQPQYPEVHT